MPPRRASPARSSSVPAPSRTTRSTAPHPAAEPLHRGALHLLRLLRPEDAASGISPARLSALSVLVFGGPSTLGELAAAEGVSAPTMSRLVTELEREGWIVRRVDPADARSAQLQASAAAKRLLFDGRARRLGALSNGLRSLTTAERRSLEKALPALDRLVRGLMNAPAPAAGPAKKRSSARRPDRVAPSRRRRFD